MLDVNKQQ